MWLHRNRRLPGTASIPQVSDSVPTVMDYVVVPMYEQQQIYLTEDGMPISSLEGFGENDSVTIEGVLYGREAVDGIGIYWMLEVFTISEGTRRTSTMLELKVYKLPGATSTF